MRGCFSTETLIFSKRVSLSVQLHDIVVLHATNRTYGASACARNASGDVPARNKRRIAFSIKTQFAHFWLPIRLVMVICCLINAHLVRWLFSSSSSPHHLLVSTFLLIDHLLWRKISHVYRLIIRNLLLLVVASTVSSIDLLILDFSVCTILIFLLDVTIRPTCHSIIIVYHFLIRVLVGIVQQNATMIIGHRVFNLLSVNKPVLIVFSIVLAISIIQNIFRVFKSVRSRPILVLSCINDRHLFQIVNVWTFNQKDGWADLENVANTQLVQRTLLSFGAQTQPSSISRPNIIQEETSLTTRLPSLFIGNLRVMIWHLTVFLDTEWVLLVSANGEPHFIHGDHSISRRSLKHMQLGHARFRSSHNFEFT